MGQVPRWLLLTLCTAGLPACSDSSDSAPPQPPDAAPTALILTVVSSARIDMSWTDNSSNEASFLIQRSTDGVNFTQVGSVGLNNTTFSDFGLQPGTPYFYRVVAFTDAGTSLPTSANAATDPLNWAAGPANPAGLEARTNHTAVYDSIARRMIVFGGVDFTGTQLNDVWALDLTGTGTDLTWTELFPGGATVPGMLGHSAVFDAANNRMIVFGGIDDNVGFNSDVWILDLAGPTWTQATAPSPPTARWLHKAIYDTPGQRMLVYGGNDGGAELGDVQILSLPSSTTLAWTSSTPGTGPLARSSHAAAFDSDRGKLIVFGGLDNNPAQDGSTLSNDTWDLNLNGPLSWTLYTFSGTPQLRSGHTAAYDSENQRMLIFGGQETTNPPFTMNQQIWALNLFSTPQWSLLNAGGAVPTGRINHSAVYDSFNRRMIIFGGDDGNGTPFTGSSRIPL